MNQAELAKKVKRLEQDKMELLAALRPFVNMRQPYHTRMPDKDIICSVDGVHVTVQDLLRAESVYAKNS